MMAPRTRIKAKPTALKRRTTQQARAMTILRCAPMVRAGELADAGITGATIRRMQARGLVIRIARGLYRMQGTQVDAQSSLAEAAKLVPRGVICLVSAAAHHGLIDALPNRVWIAISRGDWHPKIMTPPLNVVRFRADMMRAGVASHRIGGVQVRMTNPARTVVDLFRYRRTEGRRYRNSTGLALALQALREALRQRKATPTEISRFAVRAGVWKQMRPYLEALTLDA